ncbi:DUF6491 family protein [Pseudomonas borbori]|uniref:Lipoprotein n=1 Tax=Pseudomonas borbori TaxID=289003 RepID=A0A1I5VI02_9PSED|nr:DUF6491 family protein [Pseudomonas borbori]SFQ07135.1 hypothetical protein SAMN05216190_13126 [Pseudomonas borbori]
MHKPKFFSILLVNSLLASMLLTACSQQALRDETLPLAERLAVLGFRQGEPVKSVWQVDIDGWQYLDKSHMVLGSGPGRSYLVEFSYPCRNLNFSNLITCSTTVDSLTTLDKIVSIDSGGFPEHCLIGEIYRLEQVPRVKAAAS